MNEILEQIASVPTAFWTALLALGTAYLTASVTHSQHIERLKLQLQHDAAEKAKERIVAVRREVYLSVIEELQKANAHLANLPTIDPATVNIADGIQGFFSAAARLQLVAEPTTASLASALVNEYGGALFELMAILQPTHAARSDIRISDHHYNLALKETSRVNAEMTSQNESGNPDPLKMKALGASFKFQSQQMEKYSADSAAAWARFNATNITFQTSILSKLGELVAHQMPLLAALRQDLGLSGDLAQLEKQIHGQMKQAHERVEKLITSISDSLEKSAR